MKPSPHEIWRSHRRAVVPKRPVLQKTLTARNEFWSENSAWEKRDGIWRCKSGTGVLKRFVGMNPDQVKLELVRLGATWEWS